MKFISTLLALSLPMILSAQFLTHGPVTGAVTHEGARVYLRTGIARPFTLELATDAAFTQIVQTLSDSTRVGKDNSRIVDLSGLQPATRYYLRFAVNGGTDAREGSFKTAPAPGAAGHYVFVTGSCQETPNMKVYDVMPRYHPDMLIHTGDYTYPSYQIGFNTYPRNWSAVELAWRRRYEEFMMDTMLFNTPIAYVPDDDDNWGESADYRTELQTVTVGGVVYNSFEADTVMPIEKQHVLQGYTDFFPGYPLAAPAEGQYHDFRYGNCHFLFTDGRSLTDVPMLAYRYDANLNQWYFEPGPDHSILGDNQRAWLLNTLSQSDAYWKFIVCGVPFNPSYRRLIDVGMTLQGLVFNIAGVTGSGMRLAIAFSNYWAGHPVDVDALLGTIRQQNIQNCIFISGDTHHNVMDDGTNSKLPELNASGLSVTTTELAYQIDQYAQLLGQPSVRDSLWNKGGNGLGNTNFKNAFGKIEVFGEDSVTLCVIDEDDVTLACQTVRPGYTVLGVEQPDPPATRTGMLSAFPNPASESVQLKADESLFALPWTAAFIVSTNGSLVSNLDAASLRESRRLDLRALPTGLYVLMVDTPGFRTGCPLLVLK